MARVIGRGLYVVQLRLIRVQEGGVQHIEDGLRLADLAVIDTSADRHSGNELIVGLILEKRDHALCGGFLQ